MGGKEVWGDLGTGLLKIPSTFVVMGLSQYWYLRDRDLLFALERKRCYNVQILSFHIHFCYSWDNFIPSYPFLPRAVQQPHQERNLHRTQQLLKCDWGLPENTTTNAPKHRKEPASCRTQRGSTEQHPRYKEGEIPWSPGQQPHCSGGVRNPILYGSSSSHMLQLPVQGENKGAFNTLSLQDTDRRW